jgi:subtilisin family serine protease
MKKPFCLFLAVGMLAASSLKAQDRFSVKFKYKKSDNYSLSNPSAFLSLRAIERREKQNIELDSTDLPLNPAYLDALVNIPGVTVLNTSKWLNRALIETSNAEAINSIDSLPFVARTFPVAALYKKRPANNTAAEIFDTPVPVSMMSVASDTIDYGSNYSQVHIHEGEYLHNKGFRGQGISIAILDAGFYAYDINPAFDSVRMNHQVLGEYDFVKKETSVAEDNVHGANCFSIMAANRPGYIVGTAPKASYWLFRTEDVSSEKPVEEFNWIEAAERADSVGADMISSSLGYVNFDDPQYNHEYEERDGNTALITIAADMAAQKGMIVVNAIGNSGNVSNESKYVMCPADADSVLTVGAVNSSGIVGKFSSWGPTGLGKIKPNVVSMGEAAVYAKPNGDPASGNGTSYSTPNIAGLIACLWQAFNEFSNMEILDAVQRSADRFNNPDNRYGYGIPNFETAYSILAAKRLEKANSILKDKWIVAYPVPFRQQFTVVLKAPASGSSTMRLLDANGKILTEKNLQVNEGSHYTVPMNVPLLRKGVYYVQYSDGANNATLRVVNL